MKAILTCYAIFSFSQLAMAQENVKHTSDQTIEIFRMFEEKSGEQIKKRIPKRRTMARLYLFKNSRVKKELSFRTKKNKSKLA